MPGASRNGYRGGRGGGRRGKNPSTKNQQPQNRKKSPEVAAGEPANGSPPSPTCEVDNNCVLCAHEIEIYAVGKCDHAICYKCSAKMRILCKDKTCPVCRAELTKVILSYDIASFQELSLRPLTPERRHHSGFMFADNKIAPKFAQLFEFKCAKCPDRLPDITYDELKTHVRQVHQMQFCDICIKYNKLFVFEYKLYTRSEMAMHRRKGDPDDTSHRGHPECLFCQERFLDTDMLFHHLRKNHYFCHICDGMSDVSQSATMGFYNDYDELQQHFGEEHYLCTEGDCAYVQFTNVFRNKVDYQAHLVNEHSGARSRQQQRRDRMIDLDFQYQSRAAGARTQTSADDHRPHFRERRNANRSRNTRSAASAFEREDERERAMVARAMQESARESAAAQERRDAAEAKRQQEEAVLLSLNDSDLFPTLGQSSAATSSSTVPKASNPKNNSATTQQPSDHATSSSNNNAARATNNTNIISKWNQTTPNNASLDTDFPSLQSSSTSNAAAAPFLAPKMTAASAIARPDTGKKKNANKANIKPPPPRPSNQEEFPSLPCGPSASQNAFGAPPKWKKASNKGGGGRGGGRELNKASLTSLTHTNTFAVLSRNEASRPAATSISSDAAVSSNSKKKKKRQAAQNYEDRPEKPGFTVVAGGFVSQESYGGSVQQSNVKLIEAKPDQPTTSSSMMPPPGLQNFSNDFDFPSLGGAPPTLAPPPGFKARYKSPFLNGSTSAALNPPPGLKNSHKKKNARKETASSGFPSLSSGAPPQSSAWASSSENGVIESLRGLNVKAGTGKGSLNLANVFDYKI